MDEVGALFYGQPVVAGVLNEAFYHLLGTLGVADAFKPGGSYTQPFENPGSCISNQLVVIFEDVLQIFETVLHEVLPGSVLGGERPDEERRLLSDLAILVLHKC